MGFAVFGNEAFHWTTACIEQNLKQDKVECLQALLSAGMCQSFIAGDHYDAAAAIMKSGIGTTSLLYLLES